MLASSQPLRNCDSSADTASDHTRGEVMRGREMERERERERVRERERERVREREARGEGE